MNVVVTGASRGIGLELSTQALAQGAQVLALARQPRKSSGLQELKNQYPAKLQTLEVDVTNPECGALILKTLEAWPGIDVLINNAGVYRKGDALEDFLESFHINSVIPFLLTQTLLPKLRKSPRPRVAQVTSLMGSIADNHSGGSHAYRASKTALNMLNKCLALENDWLTAIVIHPGWVKTDMGGSEAPLEATESAHGIWNVLNGLKIKDSGAFFDYRGQSLAW